MIKLNDYRVLIFTDQDALREVLNFPSGDIKESVAIPASSLQACERLVKFSDSTSSYYCLFIIPDTRDKRMLVISQTLSDMIRYVVFGAVNIFNGELRGSVLTVIRNFKE